MERGWGISGHVGVCGICTAGSVPWHGEGTGNGWKETLPKENTCKNCRLLWTNNIIIENWNPYTKETLTNHFFALICASKHWIFLHIVIKTMTRLWFPAFWLAHWGRLLTHYHAINQKGWINSSKSKPKALSWCFCFLVEDRMVTKENNYPVLI